MQKFIIGFTLILMLLIALALVGYRSQSGVVELARVSDTINTIGARLALARLHEQGFIISRNNENVNTVLQALDEVKAEIAKAETAHADDAVKGQLSTIQSRTADYEQAFDAFVALVNTQTEKAARMNEKAAFALDLTSRIRDREQEQLEEIRQTSQMVIARKAALVDAAAQVYNTALEARAVVSRSSATTIWAPWPSGKARTKSLKARCFSFSPRCKHLTT